VAETSTPIAEYPPHRHELSRLLRMVLRYWAQFSGAVVLMALFGALEGAIALLITPILDRVLKPHGGVGKVVLLQHGLWGNRPLYVDDFIPRWFSHNPASMVVALFMAAVVLKSLAKYSGTYLINYVGFGVVTDLRNALYEKLINQSASFFHKHSTAKLMSTAVNDVDRIQTAASHSLADALQQAFTLAALVVVLVKMSWSLTLISFLVMPLVIIPAVRLGRRVRRTTRRGQDNLADVQHILHETLTGNWIVKAFNMEWREIQRFRQAALRLFRQNLLYIQQQGISSPLMEIVGAATFGFILLYGRGAINKGLMTLGMFFTFLFALLRIYQPLRRIAGIYNSFQEALGSSERVFEYMDAAEEVRDAPGARRLRGFRDSIVFDHCSFCYRPDEPILRDVDLTIHRGEVVAVAGSSGAGKSTLVNLIPRFFEVTAGRLLIDGHDVREYTLRSLRDQIAYVTQDTILFNDTVADNISYGSPHVSEARIHAAAQAALADEFIRQMPEGYATVLGERGMRLSGGQRQRIAIARALLKDAPILILDEATSALDAESETLVQHALANLMRNRTVVVIAHRLSTIRSADRIVVLDGGRVVESGSHEELLAHAVVYRRLYELQFTDLPEAAGVASGLAAGAPVNGGFVEKSGK
jgi:subfamily B ATP-binding cassette protein MsbA